MGPKAKILVIDDEMVVLKSCQKILSAEGYELQTVRTGVEGLERLSNEKFDLVLTDLMMPEMSGIEVLKRIKALDQGLVTVMMTGYSTVQTAVEAMKLGASDYIPKPFTYEELLEAVERALEKKKCERELIYGPVEPRELRTGLHDLLGRSEKMQDVYALIQKVAPTGATVLILGESGTGKELVAKAVHEYSDRRDRRFLAADCGTLSANLLESELFGHVKGSFTGASYTRPGLFEVAEGGTLFLDEISNISLEVQGKLLRVLEEKEFKPVGGSESKRVDVRFIAASNRDLRGMVREGSFREDLFYRLNVFPLTVPPLRERREDIPLLARYFLQRPGREARKDILGFTPEAMTILTQYHWPGNVRELKSLIERMVIMAEGKLLMPDQLRDLLAGAPPGPERPVPETSEELKAAKKKVREEASREIEKAFVIQALSRSDYNVTRAAENTGMLRPNFQALMKKYRVRIKDLRGRRRDVSPGG